jgi:hypothetical protein
VTLAVLGGSSFGPLDDITAVRKSEVMAKIPIYKTGKGTVGAWNFFSTYVMYLCISGIGKYFF